jgi:hypothetical protein
VRNAHEIKVEITEGKRTYWRQKRRWQDNIKIDINETECHDVDWIHLTQDRGKQRPHVDTVMNPRVPINGE